MTGDAQKTDEKARLIVAIEEAFDATSAPRLITDCDCPWCLDVVADFAGRTWLEMEDARIGANFSSLASLSPDAFHHFLPAYLRYSLKHFNLRSDVCEHTIYAVAPTTETMKHPGIAESTRARLRCFDKKQAEIILQFLALVSANEELSDFHSDLAECVANLKRLLNDLRPLA